MKFIRSLFIVLSFSLTAAPAMAEKCAPIPMGSSEIRFANWAGPTLPVFLYRPQGDVANARVVFVMHGVYRDGDRYRDEWRQLAEEHNLIIVVPNFSQADFPGSAAYNLGNLFDKQGRIRPHEQWSFAAIEPLFDRVVCGVGGPQSGYALYGHSAGAQFVHRYAAIVDAPRLEAAVAANAGWYTMPTDAAFPYGWGGNAAPLFKGKTAVARPLTILLGTQDIDRADPNFRRTEDADAQGLTRFARGHSFFAAGQKLAEQQQTAFGWQVVYAPGVGHDNGAMAPFAIPYLRAKPTAQDNATAPQTERVTVADLLQLPDVAAAMATIFDLESDWAIERLITLTEIPAPPFGEQKRAEAFAQMLRDVGLIDVHIDTVGNVIGRRKGKGNGPTIMLAAHLDTVFSADTDVRVKRDGNRYTAPGIGDNSRGLVSLLLVARAMQMHGIETDGDILFVGTVGEEGEGNLRGMRHIFAAPDHNIDRVIAIDGGNMARLVTSAVGSNRYRITFAGPGGHSYGAFGTVNPHHATAFAISDFVTRAELVTQSGPKATFSVATLSGGTGVNVIPASSTFEIDLRSSDPNRLAALDAILMSSLNAALNSANVGKEGDDRLTLTIEDIGKRPAASNEDGDTLVTDAASVLTQLGLTPEMEASSTDANSPMSLGIPSITISRGGINPRSHSLDEYWVAENQHLGPQALLLLVLLQAGISK